MKLVQYCTADDKTLKVGVCIDNEVFCLPYPSMMSLLEKGVDHDRILAEAGQSMGQPLGEVLLEAPVTGSDKVICIGLNYVDHCKEQNVPIPEEPVVFSKFSSCISGPYADLPRPSETAELDYEVELAFVISKAGKHIPVEDAANYVAGFTVAHDVSAREWQMRKNGGQFLVGKSMDNFCPIGPYLVTAGEIADPSNLRISCRVNGKTTQDSSTSQMVFDYRELVAFLSRFFTLLPGDLVLTGTPPGVGVFQKPPVFLSPGDVVECEVESIGVIRNRVVEELII